MHQKRVLNPEVSGLEGLLQSDNIIGQIASFVFAIIKSGLNYAEKMKKLTYDRL